MKVYSRERGLRTLKEGVSFDAYREKYPSAIIVKGRVPSFNTIEKWDNDGISKTPCGCRVEPDGYCSHGNPSWTIILGLV